MNRYDRRDTAPTRSHYAEFRAFLREKQRREQRRVRLLIVLLIVAGFAWETLSTRPKEGPDMQRAGESPAHIVNGLAARP